MAHVITDNEGEQHEVELAQDDDVVRLVCANSGELLVKASVHEGVVYVMTTDPVFDGADVEPQVQRILDASKEQPK